MCGLACTSLGPHRKMVRCLRLACGCSALCGKASALHPICLLCIHACEVARPRLLQLQPTIIAGTYNSIRALCMDRAIETHNRCWNLQQRAWTMHGPCMDRACIVHGPCMDRAWIVHAPCMDRACTVHAPCMDRAWTVHAPCMYRA